MDWGEHKNSVGALIKKYRWACLILLAGVAMMCFPQSEEVPEEIVQPEHENISLQNQLEQILSNLEGAGKVSVLLTTASGAESHYQMDEDVKLGQDSKDHRKDTVLITGTDRSQTGLLRRVDSPVYLGAVVLCQGAGNPSVRLAIVDAVGTATALTSDKISVLKMK